ncbi:response regulator transcription factor [Hippea sp. KM1]|uniref:response regulator transcription factor n=1 Tax=Hippea sp. KM1 TaxID=944481 RepID=UPI0004AD0FF8|nr:response regulator transcription factor [Hippea sp. KM1]
MIRVLIVEDDKYLGDAVKLYLNKNGFECDWISDDRDVASTLNFKGYDVVILDLMLKYEKGENILSMIKSKYNLPVIILTAKGKIEDKKTCFELGADDYMVKPFDPRELVLRIKSVCRRYGDETVKVGDVRIDLSKETVMRNGENVNLTKKEWDLLTFLVKNRNRVVSSDEILSYVWPDGEAGDDSVRAYIKRLRDALGHSLIETVKGRGYRLSG